MNEERVNLRVDTIDRFLASGCNIRCNGPPKRLNDSLSRGAIFGVRVGAILQNCENFRRHVMIGIPKLQSNLFAVEAITFKLLLIDLLNQVRMSVE